MSSELYATNSGLKPEASINIQNVHGVGGSILPRLIFQVRLSISDEQGWHLRKQVQAWSFGLLTGELVVGNEVVSNVRPYSVNRRRLGTEDYPSELHLNIELPIDAARLEWLEQQRAGGSFEAKLRFKLQVQIFGNNQHTPQFSGGLLDETSIEGTLHLVVPDTQWRERVLPCLGYGKVLVVELPAIGLNSCAALDHSFKALKKAQHQFSLGLYDETAGSCRVALDQFFELVEEEKEDGTRVKVPKLKSSWETRLGEATYKWLEGCLVAVKIPANKPHHSPNNHFDRLGAQMLLMITVALVSYAAHQISVEVQI
jgi:hypothetical protein